MLLPAAMPLRQAGYRYDEQVDPVEIMEREVDQLVIYEETWNQRC